MHIRPLDRFVRATPTASHRWRRRREVLRWMLAGSVLLHLALLVLVWLLNVHRPVPDESAAASDVSVVFQSPGAKQAATASPNPAPEPSATLGNPKGGDTSNPSTHAPTAPAPPPQSEPPAPQPPTLQPPEEAQQEAPPAPQQEASLQPPQPEAPATPPPRPQATEAPPPEAAPPPAVTPTPPTQPPTVSLDSSDEGETQVVPKFPNPPTPLPPLTVPTPPRPAQRPRPRTFTQSVPKSSSGFPLPQNWSLATGPESLLSQRGTDVSSRPRGSKSDASVKIVSGADPGPDWISELRRWVNEHDYYPREAGEQGQEGASTVTVTIDHYGQVQNVELVDRSGYPLLDMAWVGTWRHAKVPPFPQGTQGDSTTLIYTLDYIITHGRR